MTQTAFSAKAHPASCQGDKGDNSPTCIPLDITSLRFHWRRKKLFQMTDELHLHVINTLALKPRLTKSRTRRSIPFQMHRWKKQIPFGCCYAIKSSHRLILWLLIYNMYVDREWQQTILYPHPHIHTFSLILHSWVYCCVKDFNYTLMSSRKMPWNMTVDLWALNA